MTRKYTNIPAYFILGAMFLLLFTSALNDSATFDEVAHIGAGYTYLKYKDSRLNPEHPPLMKDLAALPLMLLNFIFVIIRMTCKGFLGALRTLLRESGAFGKLNLITLNFRFKQGQLAFIMREFSF